MVFTKLLLENALTIRPCNYGAASEPLLPKVPRCIPVLSSRYIGKCAARVLKRSGLTETKIQILYDHVGHTRFHIVEMGCQMVQLLSAYIVGPTMFVNLTPAFDNTRKQKLFKNAQVYLTAEWHANKTAHLRG